ncbi:phage baseplate protein [Pectobacterium versatile]|uniref:phage baseplate protein n=1 Tax=Pectobacterium versatile TaxID=2488639 RepID=UPI003806739A
MDILSVMFRQRSRKIGIIIPDVVISEKHADVLEITEHPVEKPTSSGAGFIADHAYRRPSEVVMEVGFSGGGSLLDSSLLDTSRIGLSLGLSPKEVYQQLLDLQRLRLPFDVVTGKRLYSNMLIRSLDVTTDRTSENVLMAVITLREIIISETSSAKVAPKEEMKLGATTSDVQNSGTKTPQPVNNSVLNSIGGAASSAVRRL